MLKGFYTAVIGEWSAAFNQIAVSLSTVKPNVKITEPGCGGPAELGTQRKRGQAGFLQFASCVFKILQCQQITGREIRNNLVEYIRSVYESPCISADWCNVILSLVMEPELE